MFDPADYLAQHGGDALKALEALATKRDEEGQDAQRARRQRDDAKRERDALKDQLTDLEGRTVPDGATVLTGDDATAWQTFKERGGLTAFDEAEQVKSERDALKRQAAHTEAAQALSVPADALAEILEGKPLEKRTVKGEDGKDAEQWGIPTGETFKPLSELRSVQLLTAAPAPAPTPGLPFPAQRPTPAPTQALSVADLTAQKAQSGDYTV